MGKYICMVDNLLNKTKEEMEMLLDDANTDFDKIVREAQSQLTTMDSIHDEQEFLYFKEDEIFDVWQMKIDDLYDMKTDCADEIFNIQTKLIDGFGDGKELPEREYKKIYDSVQEKLQELEDFADKVLMKLEDCYNEQIDMLNGCEQ